MQKTLKMFSHKIRCCTPSKSDNQKSRKIENDRKTRRTSDDERESRRKFQHRKNSFLLSLESPPVAGPDRQRSFTIATHFFFFLPPMRRSRSVQMLKFSALSLDSRHFRYIFVFCAKFMLLACLIPFYSPLCPFRSFLCRV